METPHHVWVDEGLLSFDRDVLELFRNDGRQGSWRLHALIIRRWDVEHRKKGVSTLRVWDTDRHYESALFATERTGEIERLMAKVSERGRY